MNTLKLLILLIAFLYITGCATVGPTIIIETDEPAEDFVVLCKKTKSYLFNIGHGGRDVVTDHVIVTESGKEVSCGFMVGGSDGYVSVMHPVLVSDRNSHYTKDDVRHIIFNKTALDILDEEKAKFEAGYWDKYENPGSKYAHRIAGCGISKFYLDYYSKVKKVDRKYFKEKYNDIILKCQQKYYKEVQKHDPVMAGRISTVEKRMELMWGNEKWRKYE